MVHNWLNHADKWHLSCVRCHKPSKTPETCPDLFLGPPTRGLHVNHSATSENKKLPSSQGRCLGLPIWPWVYINPLTYVFCRLLSPPMDHDWATFQSTDTEIATMKSELERSMGGDIFLLLSFLSFFSLYIFLSIIFMKFWKYSCISAVNNKTGYILPFHSNQIVLK